MNGDLRGGLLVAVGVLLGWLVFDSPSEPPVDSPANDSTRIVEAIEELGRLIASTPAVATAGDPQPLESRPARRPSTTPDGVSADPQLVEVLARIDEQLGALLRRGGFTAQTGAHGFADMRAGSRPLDAATISDTVTAARASQEDEDVVMTRRWLLESPAAVLSTFGRPTQISTGNGGEYWSYEVTNPQTGVGVFLGFAISDNGYVYRVDC